MLSEAESRETKRYACGLDAAVDIIGGKWKVLIIWALGDQTRRFGELRRMVSGISEKVLYQHLREMEANNLVHRHKYDGGPLRVEYSLTPLGRSLSEALEPLHEWGNRHMQETGTVSACMYA